MANHLTDRPPQLPVQPLFAQHSRMWLGVWSLTLEASLLVATALAVNRAGSWAAFWSAPNAALIATLALLLAALGSLGLAWPQLLFRRTAHPLLLVALSWGLMVWLGLLNELYFFLSTVAILQAFIFLPAGWAVAALGALLSLTTALHLTYAASSQQVYTPGALPAWVIWSAVLSTAGAGVVILAVVWYIHRSNVEASVRQCLIEKLEHTQRDLAEREREAGILEERARLARDLHDTLAQGLASVVTQLSAAELALDGNADTARKHLGRARDTARANLAEIRRLVWALRPTALENTPFEAALERVLEQWSRESGVQAELVLDGPMRPLHAHAEVALLRLAQEALSNVARHAQARQVRVSLGCERGFVMLSVDDDGQGFNPDAPRGLGLTGMRERACALNGRLLIDSTPGEGSSLTVALPLAEVVKERVSA